MAERDHDAAISQAAHQLVMQILQDVSTSLKAGELCATHSMRPSTAEVRQLSEKLVGNSLLAALKHLSAAAEQQPLSMGSTLAMIEATIQVIPSAIVSVDPSYTFV